MKSYLTLCASLFFCLTGLAIAAKPMTTRLPQLSNEKVDVWQTIIYPSKNQQLPMHRHEQDRVVIALTDGILKVTNNKGQSHVITLKKDQAYYLPKDKPNELHNDENITNATIKVMVVNLK